MIRLVAVMACFFLVAEVRAEDSSKAVPSADKVVIKKKTIIDFSNVNIEGELRKPEGSYYSSRKKTRFNKLISVRQNFVPEILSSTDDL